MGVPGATSSPIRSRPSEWIIGRSSAAYPRRDSGVTKPTTRGRTCTRAWVWVWLWNSKGPERESASICSQESSPSSPPVDAAVTAGASSIVGGSGPGRETVRPGIRKTIPVIPNRRRSGAPTVHRLALPSSKVSTIARSGTGRVPIRNSK